jgi:ATP-binding cassette subfamily B protein
VTLVPQNPVLFSGSLGSNIGYGLENCTLGMLKEAARRASADGFIESLEQKYDTGRSSFHSWGPIISV